jgi:diguanylate cyclase (GGDEF)-like protein/PAS domain S-box-containing protein
VHSAPRRQRLAGAAALALGYYALAAIADAASPESHHVITFWPSSGLLLTVLLFADRRRWPELVGAGALAAAGFNLATSPAGLSAPFVAADVVVALVGASLIRAWAGGLPDPRRIRDVVALSVVGGAVAPGAGALVAAVGAQAFGDPAVANVALTFLMANSIGVILVAPLAVAVAGLARRLPRARALELAGLTLASAVVSLGFLVTELPLTWVLLIAPIAAALRLGLLGSAAAFAPVTIVGLLATTRGYGPFASAVESDADAIALLQGFAAVGATLCNVMAATVSQLASAMSGLRRSEERFRMLVEGVRDHAIFTLDGVGRIDSWNASARGVFGYGDDEVAGGPLADLGAGEGQEDLRAAVAQVLQTGEFEGEAAVRRDDGVTFLGRFTISRLDPDGDANGGFAVVVRDVTETRRAERQLRHMALHDPLTGLLNRSLLTDRMAVALAAAERADDHVAVLFCDLDRFKVINDSLGHEVGDAVLVGIADRFRQVVRAEDTVARHGGDEFVVCFGGVADTEEAIRLAERVRGEIERPLLIDGEPLYVGASIGIALSSPGARPEDLLRDADVAMYRAKQTGKGYALADEADRTRAIGRLRGETAVRHALERGELTLHYQPIVDMAEDTIVGLEALLRWRHPVEGLLGPGEFIRVAEETGAIGEIGAWVIREACAAGQRFRDLAPEHAGLVMNVNVSPRQLGDGLVPAVVQALAVTGTPPELLCLELTETTMIEAGTAHVRVIEELEALGVRLAIDDFGAGHSSLHYLSRLPVDSVKLDRSFVTGMVESEGGAPILRAAVSMASALGLDAVAEGVETPEEREALVQMGYRFAQGFHFARPAPEAATAALLTRPAPASDPVRATT